MYGLEGPERLVCKINVVAIYQTSEWCFSRTLIPSGRDEGLILRANLRNFCSLPSQFLPIFYPTGLVYTEKLFPSVSVVSGGYLIIAVNYR